MNRSLPSAIRRASGCPCSTTSPSRSHLGRAVGTLAALGALLAPAVADAAPVYLRSAVSAPWGQTANEQAMTLAFGANAWQDLRFEQIDPAAVFSAANHLVYLEGGDGTSVELEAFLSGALPQIEAWVAAGGALFVNAAPNEDDGMSFGFGGVSLVYPGESSTVVAADAALPPFVGPFLPVVASYTGSSASHAHVIGPGLVPVLNGSNAGIPVVPLAVKPWGDGVALFGGLTTSNFWTPTAEALNLRANLLVWIARDVDADGVVDLSDNCAGVANPDQADADGDAAGDVCDTDDDGDGVADVVDNCPGLSNAGQADLDLDGLGDPCDPDDDGDGTPDAADNCPVDADPTQADADADGAGDVCDPDDDGDGVLDAVDNCDLTPNPGQEDADGDGVGDACAGGGDGDGDGVPDGEDNCPDVANVGQSDVDEDGAGDACDDDDDGDGVDDAGDNCLGLANADQADADGDGIGDACDSSGEGGGGQGGGDATGGGAGEGGSDEPSATTGTGSESTGSTTGASGAGGADGGAGGDDDGAADGGGASDGGCGCDVKGRGGASSRLGGLLLAALVALGVRRRRAG